MISSHTLSSSDWLWAYRPNPFPPLEKENYFFKKSDERVPSPGHTTTILI